MPFFLYHEKMMDNWFNNDDMWRVFYDCMFAADGFARAHRECGEILELLPTPVKSVMDLACGPGRHLLGFAERGLAVTGVDLSGYLLNQAAQHIADADVEATLIQADLLKFKPKQSFDLVTNLFSSFGYYDNSNDNQEVLNRAYQWLNKSGYFVLDVFSKEQAAMHIEPVHCTEYENGDLRFERPLLSHNMSVYSNEWILVSGQKAHRWQYQHYVYSATELAHMLNQAGFQEVDVYGSFSGDEYDMEAERLVLVAHK